MIISRYIFFISMIYYIVMEEMGLHIEFPSFFFFCKNFLFYIPKSIPQICFLEKGLLSEGISTKLFFLFQSVYSKLPPSMARFSPDEPDIVVYTGYGMQKNLQFYSLSQRKVCIDLLTHYHTIPPF